jgi:hypothetical protein
VKTRSLAEAVRHIPILHLDQVGAFFGPDKPLQSITLPLVGKFLKSDALLRLPNVKERAPQTIAKTIRVFRMFLFWAKEQGYIEQVPLTKDIPIGRSQL